MTHGVAIHAGTALPASALLCFGERSPGAGGGGSGDVGHVEFHGVGASSGGGGNVKVLSDGS